MARRIPFKSHPDQVDEKNRYYCQYCGFPCLRGRDKEGSFGDGGWDFSTGSISDSDLISNGSFTANTTGWTAVNGTIASTAGGQSGNCLTLTRSSGDSQYAYQALSGLDIGLMYRARGYVKSGTSGDEAFALQVLWNDRDTVVQQTTGTSSSTWTRYTVYWRAREANNVIAVLKNSLTAGTMLFDEVDVYAWDFASREDQAGCPFCGSLNWRK